MKKYSLIIALFISSLCFAQKGKEVGFWLGTSYYYGDLNTTVMIKKARLAGGIMARYNFNTRVCIKGALSYGRIAGDDALSKNTFEKSRNLSFRSDIIDLTVGGEINFLDYYHGSKNAWYTPFLAVGINLFHFNPQAKLGNTWYKLRKLGTEGQDGSSAYGAISAGFSLGGGFKFDINKLWSVNIEFSNKRVFTDYLDDVSSKYPNKATLLDRKGEVAVALSDRSLVDGIGIEGRQRGNSRDNDNFTFIGVSLMRYFGGIECPKISEIKL